MAREARHAGINWTFAPVVDINTAFRSAIAGTRSFGSDVARVLAHASAYLRAMQSEGLACTAKHWPGEGQDDRDQHLVTTTNPQTMAEWDALRPSLRIPHRAARDERDARSHRVAGMAARTTRAARKYVLGTDDRSAAKLTRLPRSHRFRCDADGWTRWLDVSARRCWCRDHGRCRLSTRHRNRAEYCRVAA